MTFYLHVTWIQLACLLGHRQPGRTVGQYQQEYINIYQNLIYEVYFLLSAYYLQVQNARKCTVFPATNSKKAVF